MKTQSAAASRRIDAPAETIYNIIADYRNKHPHILPKKYFISLDVEAGGYGAGTIVNFEMRLLGQTRFFHSIITEPDPGRILVETDLKTGIPTSFQIEPAVNGHQTQLTIATELRGQNLVEGFIAKLLLQKVYRQELELVANMAETGSIDRQDIRPNG